MTLQALIGVTGFLLLAALYLGLRPADRAGGRCLGCVGEEEAGCGACGRGEGERPVDAAGRPVGERGEGRER